MKQTVLFNPVGVWAFLYGYFTQGVPERRETLGFDV